jgi:branched-chain amino acid transport system permease protein
VFSFDLLLNAVVAGILLGGFYAAVSLGISVTFGLLEVANIAHPVFIIAGAYVTYALNTAFALDPILVGLLWTPIFYGLGVVIYRIYYVSFEQRGEQSLRGLVFFFGLLFIVEVSLLLVYGVDYRLIEAPYIGSAVLIGPIGISLRLFVPFVVSLAMTLGVQALLSRTFFGRTVLAVAQDPLALQLMGVDPVRVKQLAFGISIATAGVAGALLIVIQPVQPSLGREYIGLVFAITVLGGMGSIPGTLLGATILGIASSFTATFLGPSWAPAISFGLLLLALAFRPSGLLGR